MERMTRRTLALALLGALACGVPMIAGSQDTETGFPASAWLARKEVTQLPWTFLVGKPTLRTDLRREVRIGVWASRAAFQENGSGPDLVLFARVLERGEAVTAIRSVTPIAPAHVGPDGKGFIGLNLAMIGVVSPGKYKLELALLDRKTGRFNIGFEDLSVDGDMNLPLEKALQGSSRVELVPMAVREKSEIGRELGIIYAPNLPTPLGLSGMLSGSLPLTALLSRVPLLSGLDYGDWEDLPTFPVNASDPTHLSVISILSPPDRAQGNENYSFQFQRNLTNLLSVFTRLEVARGTTQFTGVDLSNRSLPFDRVDLKSVSADQLGSAIAKDTQTVQFGDLVGQSQNGAFFRDVLKQRFEEAEKDNSGANHVIIVVGARQAFPSGTTLRPLSPARDCHCRVFYVRFAMVPLESDDVDRLLKPYKPKVFEPLNWADFRENFGAIYQQISR